MTLVILVGGQATESVCHGCRGVPTFDGVRCIDPAPARERTPGRHSLLHKVLPGATLPAGYDELWAREFVG